MNEKLKYEVILFVTLPFSKSYFVNIPLFLQREKIRFNIFYPSSIENHFTF